MEDSEVQKLKRNLNALVEFSRIINSSLDLDFILNNVLLTCMGKFLVTRGFVAIKNEHSFKLHTSKGIPENLTANFPVLESHDSFNDNPQFREFISEAHIVIVKKIMSSSECIGILCLGEKLNKAEYSDDDREFLRTILNISSTAIQNSMVINEIKKVNRELDSRIQRLNSLFELSKEFGLFSESTKVTRLLVYSVIGQFLVSKFAVLLTEGNHIQVLESKYDKNEVLKAFDGFDLQRIETSLNKSGISGKFPHLEKMGVELIVPMQLQGRTKGLILLGNRINGMEYSVNDIEFIYSVGSLAIVSLENKKLFKEALEKQKMEEELDIARDIQRNLLPQNIPHIKNFELAAINMSSKQVGGDYYDIIKLDENSVCIAIADVSGKGVPAALVMANLQAFIKTTCRQGMKIDEATALINDLIAENITDGKFITFFWGVIDSAEGTFRYVNAGHNPPLLIRNGRIIKLEMGGIILGVMKTIAPYISETIRLEKDDVIVMFTDGITEAKNIHDEEFSDEKLEHLSLKLANKPAEEILDTVRNELQNFTAGAVQSDDITMMVLKSV